MGIGNASGLGIFVHLMKEFAGVALLRFVRSHVALEGYTSNQHWHFRSKVHRFIHGKSFPHCL